MICEKCKANIPTVAKFCPKCGARIELKAFIPKEETFISEKGKKTRWDFLGKEIEVKEELKEEVSQFVPSEASDEEMLVGFLNLCESNPDAGLEFINQVVKKDPAVAQNPLTKFARAMAYGSKGLTQLVRSKPEINFITFDEKKLRSILGITDSHLDFLEKALREIKEMEEIEPGVLKTFGTEKDRFGELRVDGMAMVLERCRPGKVQQILCWTKIAYFGTDRIWDSLRWPSEKIRPFLYVPFSFPSIVKSVVIVEGGKDTKGCEYIHCMLLRKLPDEFEPNETFGDAKIGTIYIFDDGTVAEKLE